MARGREQALGLKMMEQAARATGDRRSRRGTKSSKTIGQSPVKAARKPLCSTTALRNLFSTTVPSSENFIPPENNVVFA